MRRLAPFLLALALLAPSSADAPHSYLFVWAGDASYKASDFLGVIDAEPTSPRYGTIVASVPVGVAGTHPYHTEAEMPANGHLLANGFNAGRTWLFELRDPRHPRVLTSFGDLSGYSHPHTYVRMANGHVLATFQYRQTDAVRSSDMAMHHAMHADNTSAAAPPAGSPPRETGGLVEMDERGHVLRSSSAADAGIADKRIYPYSVLPVPALDTAVSTTTDMLGDEKSMTSQWVQLWRLSDLKLRHSLALPPGPRGDEQNWTGEPHLLPDGRSVYIHTFKCGLYLLRGVQSDAPSATLVYTFEGQDCGVPILTGHFWLQTVPAVHGLVSLDITDVDHPREVSRVSFGDDEAPHWLAIDASGRRLVLNSGGYSEGDRLFVINFDPGTGKLAVDERFRDPGANRPGVDLSAQHWPHGFSGKAAPHGAVFSKP